MPLEELQREVDRLQDEVRRWRRENRAHVDRVMEYSKQCDAMQAQREELRALAEARRARVAKLEEALRDIADHSEPMSAEIARAALNP